MVYDYFEDIVCINLDISFDRRMQSQKYFNEYNIPARFYTVQKHPKGGRYGCFDSHMKIIKDAYERGLNNILVFEDDFMPTAAFTEEKIAEAVHFMRTHDDWDIFYLGYGTVKMDNRHLIPTSIVGADVYSINIVQYNPHLTQCLCYSRKAMHKLLQEYQNYIEDYHLDICIASYMDFKNYCIVPMLFDQNFNMNYNIEPNNAIEAIIKSCYPFYAFCEANYKISALKYILNILFFDYKVYSVYIFIITIIVSLCIIMILKF